MKKIANEPKLNSNSAYTSVDEDCSRQIATSEQSDTWEMRTEKLYQVTTAKKTQKNTSKKERLLANPDVKRWFENLQRGSPATADQRLWKLHAFCMEHAFTPMEFAELARRDLVVATDTLQDHVTEMEKENPSREKHPKPYAPSYIQGVITSVKSWLGHFDIVITRDINIANAGTTPTIEEEGVPNGNELSEMFSRANLRTGASMALIGKAGLRPEVLGNYTATDGLVIGDLPDIANVEGVMVCIRSPPKINVRRTLSKNKRAYFSFLSTQGTRRLLAYLNDRILRGEALLPKSPIIAPDWENITYRGGNAGKNFLPTKQITDDIREAIRPRFDYRPYILRSYFDTQLLIAESREKIPERFIKFWMGHRGDIEAVYTVNKGRLSEELVQEMRESFQKCEKYLDLDATTEDPVLKQKEQLHSLIETATPEKVQEIFQSWSICNT